MTSFTNLPDPIAAFQTEVGTPITGEGDADGGEGNSDEGGDANADGDATGGDDSNADGDASGGDDANADGDASGGDDSNVDGDATGGDDSNVDGDATGGDDSNAGDNSTDGDDSNTDGDATGGDDSNTGGDATGDDSSQNPIEGPGIGTDAVEDDNKSEGEEGKEDGNEGLLTSNSLIEPFQENRSILQSCENIPGEDVTPYSLSLSPVEAATIVITLTHIDGSIGTITLVPPQTSYSNNSDHLRRVDVVVTYAADNVEARVGFECDSSPRETNTSTQLLNADLTTLEHGSNVPDMQTEIYDSSAITGLTQDAEGTVTYTVYEGIGCDGRIVATFGPFDVNGLAEGGGVANAGPWSPNTAAGDGPGWYTWQASYSGDQYNQASVSPCPEETVFYGQVETDVSTVMVDAAGDEIEHMVGVVPSGSRVGDTASIVGGSTDEYGNPDATGEVVYTLVTYDPVEGTCGTVPIETFTVQASNGQIPDSGLTTESLTDQGYYAWIVTYGGDGKNGASDSACGEEVFQVGFPQPEIATTVYAVASEGDDEDVTNGTVPVGTSVYDTAVITGFSEPAEGEPLGTVVYQLFDTADCAASPIYTSDEITVGADGIPAPSDVQPLDAVGTYQWVVTFIPVEGSGNLGAVSGCGDETVTVDPYQPEVATTPFGPEGPGEEGNIPLDGVISLGENGEVQVGDFAQVSNYADPLTGTITFILL